MRRALLLALALLAVAAAPASARMGSCLAGGSGSACHVWTGRVTTVVDGDTARVDIDGDGTGHAATVRFAAVQAMEMHLWGHLSSPLHECYAAEATVRVRRLVRASHGRVRLAAQDPRDMADVRLSRAIAVRVGGRWRDLGQMLIEEGHAIWLATGAEQAFSRTYALAEQRARRQGRNMWDPAHCGVGPDQAVPLKVWVNWDPPGIDSEHLDEEWTRIRNLSTTTSLALGRWWMRDAMLRRYTFPAGTTLAPGATLTVYTGPGADGPLAKHWGLDHPVFENWDDAHELGDGAYVFDPQGDLRAAFLYPCLLACSDPLQGAVSVVAHPRGEEYVDVRNVTGGAIDLSEYQLEKTSASYPFPAGSVIGPGETLRVWVGGSPSQDTRLVRHWGLPGRILQDGGDRVSVSTFDGIRLGCDAWGGRRC